MITLLVKIIESCPQGKLNTKLKNMRILNIILLMMLAQTAFSQTNNTSKKYVLVIHGGAGTILKQNMTPEKEKAYITALDSALQKGNRILANAGSAVDAVTAAIMVLEDCPLFNAGKGAVFTHDGKNELDAAIMDGSNLKVGSVAGVTTIKNPITAAKAVMEKSEHVMMAGKGAEQFAKKTGCTIVEPTYFYTEERWKGLQKALKDDTTKANKTSSLLQPNNHDDKYGTVGAVALDMQGHLAAGTSTGGMTNKRYGRIGDAPIIGAGTYAEDASCAISCTGWGEYFIRLVMAKSIADRVALNKTSLADATNEMVMKKLPALGGDGGLIAVDKNGNIAMPFCTKGMYRGYIKSNGEKQILIYKQGIN
jgi:beta-aspartyl-peptidase (threonine type)